MQTIYWGVVRLPVSHPVNDETNRYFTFGDDNTIDFFGSTNWTDKTYAVYSSLKNEMGVIKVWDWCDADTENPINCGRWDPYDLSTTNDWPEETLMTLTRNYLPTLFILMHIFMIRIIMLRNMTPKELLMSWYVTFTVHWKLQMLRIMTLTII